MFPVSCQNFTANDRLLKMKSDRDTNFHVEFSDCNSFKA